MLKKFKLALIDCPVKLRLAYSGTNRRVKFSSNEPLNLSPDVLDAWGIARDVGLVTGHSFSAETSWNIELNSI